MYGQGQQGGGYPYPGQQGGYPGQGYPGGGYPGQQGPNIGFVQPPYGQVPPMGAHLPPQSAMYGTNYSNVQDEVKGFQFDDMSIRQGFIRKVYSILMVQLFITLTIIGVVIFPKNNKQYVRDHPSLFYVSFGVSIVTLLTMVCCGDVRRKAPLNFVFLFIFTLAEGFLLSVVSAMYTESEVFLAIGITTLVCLALTIFSFQTKYDFTGMGTYLFVAVIVFMIFGLIAMFWPRNQIFQLIMSCIGALLFSCYLVYDTQIMMGGNHKFSISPEEYIFAALNLYLDIVNIFLYILSILGNSRE